MSCLREIKPNSKEIISLIWRRDLQNHSPMANLRVAYKYYEPKKQSIKYIIFDICVLFG